MTISYSGKDISEKKQTKSIPFNDKSKPFSHLFFSERIKFYFSVALTSLVCAEQRKGKGLNKTVTSNQKAAEQHSKWDKINDRKNGHTADRIINDNFSDSHLGT